MTDGKKAQFIITTLLVLALLMYHFTNYLAPSNNDTYTIYKIAQFAAMIVFIFVTSNYVPRFIPGQNHFAGDYKGESSYYISDKNSSENKELLERKSEIYFEIKQSLFTTTISGESFLNKGVLSIWHGRLFKIEYNSLYFVLDLTTDKPEFGILKLQFKDSSVCGIYYSGEPGGKYAYKVTAVKIAK